MLPCRKILCAVDFSDCSAHAVEVAADLARLIRAELTLAHVVGKGRLFDPMPADACDGDVEKGLARWSRLAEQLSERHVNVVFAQGEPSHEIVRLADNYDFVITGTHGRTGLRRAVLGSVAEKVVRHAPCHVLVARPSPWSDED